MHKAKLRKDFETIQSVFAREYIADPKDLLINLMVQFKQNLLNEIATCTGWQHGNCKYKSNCYYKHQFNERCALDQTGCEAYAQGQCLFTHLNCIETNLFMLENNQQKQITPLLTQDDIQRNTIFAQNIKQTMNHKQTNINEMRNNLYT